MASIDQQVIARLTADATIGPWATGGIYDRPLKRSGTRSTPNAFDAAGIPKPSIVVTDDGATEDPAYDGAALGYVTVWLYGPDGTTVREHIRDVIGPAVVRCLVGPADDPIAYVGPNGTGAELHAGDRLGVRESPEFETALMDYTRFVAAHMWR